MRKNKKHWKETRLGKLLTKNIPDALEIIGDVTGKEFFNKAAELIEGKKLEVPKQTYEQLKEELENDRLVLEMVLNDVKDTRDLLEKQIESKDPLVRRFTYILSGFIILFAFGFILALMFIKIPEENAHLIQFFADTLIVGSVLAVMRLFYGYTPKND